MRRDERAGASIATHAHAVFLLITQERATPVQASLEKISVIQLCARRRSTRGVLYVLLVGRGDRVIARLAVPGCELRRRPSAESRPVGDGYQVTLMSDLQEDLLSVDPGRRPLPVWWLAFLGVFCFVPAVTNSMLLPLMLPPAVADMVGDSRKAAALGLLTSVQFVLGLSMPFLGTFSDKCTGSFGRRFGRRRPFVVLGCMLSTTGAVLLKLANTFPTTMVGYSVLISGNICSWVPYTTVLPELVPASQRGVAASFQMVVDSCSWACGSGLGVLLGEHIVTSKQTYDIIILLNILQLPIGIATMGDGPGFCSPELPPAGSPDQRASLIHEQISVRDYRRDAEQASYSSSQNLQRSTRASMRQAQLAGMDYRRYQAQYKPVGGERALEKMWVETERSSRCGDGCLGRVLGWMWTHVLDFFSAFRSRAFTLLWIYLSIAYVGGLLVGTWQFYWYNDMLEPHGYKFFGHHVTNSTQTAISINGVIGRVAVVACAVPGGHLGDKFGRLPVIRVTAAITGVIGPLVYAFIDNYTVIVLLTVVTGAVQGIGSPCASALNADVLPADSDNAARDMQLISTGQILPGILIPILVGNALSWFPSHAEAYKVLYSGAAAIYGVSICVLFAIKMESAPKAASGIGGSSPSRQAYTRKLAEERFADYRRREMQRIE